MENKGNPERIEAIRAELERLAEEKLADFSSGLLRKPGEERPTGSASRVLGVRLPALRRLSRQLTRQDWRGNLETLAAAAGTQGASRDREALATREGCSFEELMLWGFLIGCSRIAPESDAHKPAWEGGAEGELPKSPPESDAHKPARESASRAQRAAQESITLQEQFDLIRQYVSVIDNWSLCDSFCASLKFAKSYPEETWNFIQPFLRSEEEYFVRFGLVMIINYFISESYVERLYGIFDEISHEGYYVKMAVAWAVSICYVKFPDSAQRYLEENRLDDFTYNKALQKIVESRCVSDEVRARMRQMKRKD